MKAKKLEFYDWFDIQKEICDVMNIEEKYFRDYHKIVGGTYKDLWHVWIDYFDTEVRNGTYNHVSLMSIDEIIEDLKKHNMEWALPFSDAVSEVWKKHNIKVVKYFW